jgi:hypothetical protein
MDTPFLWATGIEDTFIPHARPGLRALDEYELTQHYKLWKRDFDLVAETGVKFPGIVSNPRRTYGTGNG